MNYLKKVSYLILSCILALTLSGCSFTDNKDVQKKFDEFINHDFISAMEDDYVAAHIFLENPKDFGIDTEKLDVKLGSRPTIENMKENAEQLKKEWEEFQSFDRDKLTPEQQDTYDIYEYQVGLAVKLSDEKFNYYDQIFKSTSGDHFQIPTLLSDWVLRNEQDVKDLILLVKDVKPYIDSCITYTKEQEKRGLLMIDADSVHDYCKGVLDSGENSAVLRSMNENIDALNLPKEKADEYKKQLKKAFVTSFIPAYQDITNLMTEVKKGKNNEEGLAKFKYGKEYYTLLLQQSIGSLKSVEEVEDLMIDGYTKHAVTAQSIISNNRDIVKKLETDDLPKTTYHSYDAILKDISSKFKDDFPTIKDLKYNIIPIDKEIASTSGVMAYFNVPAIDGTTPKQMRVNPLTGDVDNIETYKTVAHEGFPGHMYQCGYAYENLSSPWRKSIAVSTAYTEGYATYVEHYAVKYLDGMDQDLLKLLSENESLNYSLIILSDIGIHYSGWSYDELKARLVDMGVTPDDESIKELYKQLQANPVAFEPYYVGYEEILALKEKAQKELGDKFKDKEFHEAILKSGAVPFKIVERDVDAYIKETK